MFPLTTSKSYCTGSSRNLGGKKVEGIQNGKEKIKFSLFGESIFWWKENSKESTNKLLALMTKFNEDTKH